MDSDSSIDPTALPKVLATLPPRSLVVSIATDGLFTPGEQKEIADHIPGAELVTIPSPDGHDGFLLEFESLNKIVKDYLKERAPRMYEGSSHSDFKGFDEVGAVKSVFGEAEPDPF